MKLNRLFYYCGPSRRSEQTMIEAGFGFDKTDSEIISNGWEAALQHVYSELATAGINLEREYPDRFLSPVDVFRCFCHLFCDIALRLQQHCAHDVHLCSCLESPGPGSWLALFEHEETSVGEQAAMLSIHLFDQAWPALKISRSAPVSTQSFAQMFTSFSSRARSLAQPAETAAIVAAARRIGVPVIKLERDPYEPIQGDFRIRMNSMLMLGHCANRQIIDGCFALEKSGQAAVLLRDRTRAISAARQLGMPVANTRPTVPGSAVTVSPETRDKGNAWILLVVNHQLMCVLDAGTGQKHPGAIHESLERLVVSASRSLNVGALAVTFLCPDLSQPASENGRVVTDLQIAPCLDTLLANEPGLLEQAADAFVRWLVPTGAASAIPIVAITGTNGKTTTSRMIDHVLRQCGHRTGMQCTDGRYIGGKMVDPGDNSSLMGHYRIFEDQSVDTAVLETHHRGMAVYGFAFDDCNVAVCTNVTADHIGTLGIETVEDMAVLKRSLLERARDCSVINADDAHCMAMLPFIKSRRICLTSLHKTVEELTSSHKDSFCCVSELIGGHEWVVIHDRELAHQIIAVQDIPATFDGLARFNVSNAIQAIAASYAMGIEPDAIRNAMKKFAMSVANTPGRLNFYPGLPFQVMVDFSHNPDGMRRIGEFADGIKVNGRKIVAFSGFREDPTVIGIATQIAGHFDHYMIKNYDIPEGMNVNPESDPWRIPRLVKSVLLEQGIQESCISEELDEMTAVRQTLDMAREGDLVVLLLGYAGLRVIEEFMRGYISARQ